MARSGWRVVLAAVVLAAVVLAAGVAAAGTRAADPAHGGRPMSGTARKERMIGMYVHQHWPYRHPYAARTWTLADWRGYAGGLKQLGFNTVLIWPMLETIPQPPTPSDRAHLAKMGRVIDMLHELGMTAWIVLCPNIVASNEEATRASFQTRHYYYCEELVNPADGPAVERMLAWREQLLRPLARVDGVAIIDSDPGGYPGSSLKEFVHLLAGHRRILDRVRPGIELVYWMHAGWRGWGRFYEQGKLLLGTPEEYDETLRLLKELNPEPWGIANGLQYAQPLGLAERVISFNYGRIEGEPSYPLTNFTGRQAYEGAAADAPRGVMGNAQTHCVQLPNTFAFARGAQGLPLTDAEYLRFAEKLVPGHGELILRAWRTLAEGGVEDRRSVADELDRAARGRLARGPLQGLLFGSARRFLEDLAFMLRQRAAIEEFAAAMDAGTDPRGALRRVVEDCSAWQARHGYQNNWADARLMPALRRLRSPAIDRALAVTYEARGEYGPGRTAFATIRQNFARIETYTPRLLEAMREVLAELEQSATR